MLSRHVGVPSFTSASIRLVKTPLGPSKWSIPLANLLISVSHTSSSNYHQLPTSTQNFVNFSSPNPSTLGLRSHRPPDSLPQPNPEHPPEISDQEWEIRTGRAIYVIQENLNHFFETGLITSLDKATGSPRLPQSTSTPSANPNFLEHHVIKDEDEPIYSPKIKLSYIPPVELPAPFPKTLHVEGIQLYLASSSFIRHTMIALYSDLTVQNTKLVINTPPSGISPSFPPSDGSSRSTKRKLNREKSICIRHTVTGIGRVSGKLAEWQIESTYTFSPITGLIHKHVVNSIQPAPHQAVYDAMRTSLGNLLGLNWGSTGTNAPNGAAFKGKISGGV